MHVTVYLPVNNIITFPVEANNYVSNACHLWVISCLLLLQIPRIPRKGTRALRSVCMLPLYKN